MGRKNSWVVFAICVAGCWMPESGTGQKGSKVADVRRAKVTASLLKQHGFSETDNKGVWDNSRIKLGEVCELVDCAPDDFQFLPNSNPASELGPLAYDGGQIRAIVNHLSEATFTEKGIRNINSLVKASIIVYDKSNPRPK
jgi:hypothetical protein